MGLVRSLLALPLQAPLRGTLWVARKIEDAAEREYNDPASLRKALQTLEQDLLSGAISEDEYDVAETELLMRIRALR